MPLVVFAYQKMAPGAEGIVVKNGSPIASIMDLAGKKSPSIAAARASIC